MAIPDEILRKADQLDDNEWEIVRRHPVIAYELLSPIPYLQKALEIPNCYHEKWDGSGYPRGLKGKEIPLAARIFTIADVWDAIQSDRPYNKAWLKERALAYMKEPSGKYFDPKIARTFLVMINRGAA
jgi:HD-GYP domain-containing protein (c-di-GMP phosphodiesterase class II)